MNPTQTTIKRSLCLLALLLGVHGARAQSSVGNVNATGSLPYPQITPSGQSVSTIPATQIPASAVNTNKLGFTAKVVQVDYAGADGANPFNTLTSNMELALGPAFSGANAQTPVTADATADPNNLSSGLFLDPTSGGGNSAYAANSANLAAGATPNVSVADANGYFFVSGMLNLSIPSDGGATAGQGEFLAPTWPKTLMPGIPGNPSNGEPTYDQFAESFTAYIFLTGPTVQFCVNSDDGFQMSLSPTTNPGDPARIITGAFQGGRGSANSFMTVNISSNGFYALRLDYEQGGGNANCELFTILTNGTAVLVNDTNNPLATLAYPAPEQPAKPFIVTDSPAGGSTGIIPNAPGNIGLVLQDGAVSAVTNSFVLKINGTIVATNGSASLVVTNAPIYTPSGNPIGNINAVTYLFPTNATLLPNAANTISLVYVDSSGATNTGSWTFRTTGAPVSNTAGNTSVNTNAHGFLVYPYVYLGLGQNDTYTWSEMGMSGNLGANAANLSNWPAADYGAVLTNGPMGQAYIWTNYINWDWQGPSAGDGDFRAGGGYPKSEFPGIVGITSAGTGTYYTDETSLTGNTSDNFNELVETWLYFPGPGVYNMNCNSDDGFSIKSGVAPGDVFGAFLGGFQGGRGSSDGALFGLQVPVAGWYPFRLLYTEGGGGANCEWLTVTAAGVEQLVGDPTNSLVQAAWYATNYPAYVQAVYPPINAGLNGLTQGGLGTGGGAVPFYNGALSAQVVDGAPNKVTSVKILTNGVLATLSSTVYTNGATFVTVGGPNSYLFPQGSSNNATIIYTDSASKSYTNSWSFQIASVQNGITQGAPNSVPTTTQYTLSAANQNSTVSTNITNFGYIVYPWQFEGATGPEINEVNGYSELDLLGLEGYNGADLFSASGNGPSGGFYQVGPAYGFPGYINWTEAAATVGEGYFQSPYDGNYGVRDWPHTGAPGIDGSIPTDSYSELIEAWLYFPRAGMYTMLFPTDDGISVKSGTTPGDVFGTLLGVYEGGRGYAFNPIFGVTVPTAGFYPFRVLYEEGGGGADIEWIVNDGVNGAVMVGDTNNGGLTPYMTAGSYPVYVSAVLPVINQGITGSATVNPATAVQAYLVDGSPNTIASASILINGQNAPTTSSKNAATGLTTVSVTDAGALIIGNTNNIATVIYTDSAHNSYSNSWVFKTAPIAASLTAANINKTVSTNQSNIGFYVYPWETSAGQPNDAGSWTESQILGLHGPNVSYPGPNADGSYTWTNYINWSVAGDGEGVGDFNASTPLIAYPHSRVPGWGDGLTPAIALGGAPANGKDNGSDLVLTYLNFPAPGVYTMGVNSDDGFTVLSGQAPGDVFGTFLGSFIGGRGTSDTDFSFLVTQAGMYPFRLLYENGGGGANCEWFMVGPTGTRVLINDYNQPTNTIFAYLTATNSPVYVSGVVPVISAGITGSQGSADPRSAVLAYVHDGAPVKVASVSLVVNGVAATTTTTKSGGVTTAVATPALVVNGKNTASVVYTDTAGKSYTNSWSFTTGTVPAGLPGSPVALDPSQAFTLNSADTNWPGFQAVTVQIAPASGTAGSDTRWSDLMLAGLGGSNPQNVKSVGAWYTNVANWPDTNFITTNGWAWVSNTINMAGDGGQDGDFAIATGFPEQKIPGIPGLLADSGNNLNESFQVGFQTWVAFPTPGVYSFCVSSDDGFRVTEQKSKGQLAGVNILSGGGNTTGTNYMIPVFPEFPDNGGTIGSFLPAGTAITGQLILGNPMFATNTTSNLLNAAAVKGKIVILSRGGSGGSQQISYLGGQAGALAIIEISNDASGNPASAALGGTNNGIPVLLMSVDDGLALSNLVLNATSPVTASLADDPALALGEFQGGRGYTDSDFDVSVPVAGLYPFRLVYEQGGGGCNVEFSQFLNGGLGTGLGFIGGGGTNGTLNQVLVNDKAHGAVATYAKLVANPTAIGVTPIGNITSITSSGTSVTVTFTAGGHLQQASSLAAPGAAKWTNVTGSPSSPYTTTVTTGGSLFFRLVAP